MEFNTKILFTIAYLFALCVIISSVAIGLQANVIFDNSLTATGNGVNSSASSLSDFVNNLPIAVNGTFMALSSGIAKIIPAISSSAINSVSNNVPLQSSIQNSNNSLTQLNDELENILATGLGLDTEVALLVQMSINLQNRMSINI